MIAAIIIGALLTIFGLKNQRVNISHAFAYAIAAQGMAFGYRDWETDRKSTRLNSSHITRSRMPSSA